MPVLLLAVVAFIIFNVLFFGTMFAVISERRYKRKHESEYPTLPPLDQYTEIDAEKVHHVDDPTGGGEPRWRVAG